MRAVVLRSLAVVGIGAIVLAAVLYVASTVDGRPPSVVAIALTQPLPDEATRGLPTTSLEVTFTEPVETASAVDALSIEPPVEGSVSWSGSVMIFTPDQTLALARAYTVSVAAGVVDLAGNRMTEAPPPFSFETTGPPELVEAAPADGASDVALEAPITLLFSTLMDTASVEAALSLSPSFEHELRWSGQLLEIVPVEPLRAETDYSVMIAEDAFDVSGVALGGPIELAFRTLGSGLAQTMLVPLDGSDGIGPASPIAVFFDRPIDPDSVDPELLGIVPDVSGALELVDELGNQPLEPEDGRVLRFTPSGALPANTTFEVVLAPGLAGLEGEAVAEPIAWSFTTGAPPPSLSNQIIFLSDRAGVANLWAMNPDGTAAHQLSTELSAVLDYAVSPDGSSFVVADGRRLVLFDADGTDRRVLTDDGLVEFDPSYGPNGLRLAFARADAATGRGLGIWVREIPGGEATRFELPPDAAASPAPTGAGSDLRRAPRFAPDGAAVAFVDPSGTVGILDLDDGSLNEVPYTAETPPLWLPDGSAVLLSGGSGDPSAGPRGLDEPVGPLAPQLPDPNLTVSILERSGGSMSESGFGSGAMAAAIASDGRIAYLRDGHELRVTDGTTEAGSIPNGLVDERIGGVAFAPGEDAIVVVVLSDDATAGGAGAIERVDLAFPGRDVLADEGWRPRWLP